MQRCPRVTAGQCRSVRKVHGVARADLSVAEAEPVGDEWTGRAGVANHECPDAGVERLEFSEKVRLTGQSLRPARAKGSTLPDRSPRYLDGALGD